MEQEITKHALWINSWAKILRVSLQSINCSSWVFTVYDILRTVVLSKIKTFSTVGEPAAALWAVLHGRGSRGIPCCYLMPKIKVAPRLLKKSVSSTGGKKKNIYISIVNTNKSEEEMMMTLVLLGWTRRWDEALPGPGIVDEYCHLLARC